MCYEYSLILKLVLLTVALLNPYRLKEHLFILIVPIRFTVVSNCTYHVTSRLLQDETQFEIVCGYWNASQMYVPSFNIMFVIKSSSKFLETLLLYIL